MWESKMKKQLTVFSLMVMSVFAAQAVWAQPFSPTLSADSYDVTPDAIATPRDTAVAQNIHDAVNLLLGTSYVRNEQFDSLQVGPVDRFWTDLSSSAHEGTFVFVSITAGRANTLGVYDLGTLVDQDVLGPYSGFFFSGDGSAANPFDAALTPLAPGTNFGFYLRSTGADTKRWDSDFLRNSDGYDHMVSYHMSDLKGESVYIDLGAGAVPYTFYDPFLIGFEDLPFGFEGKPTLGDEDYNDTIFLVDRVRPIPEPMSMMLLGSGLVGLVGLRKRKQ
jgi:hypothetical protein